MADSGDERTKSNLLTGLVAGDRARLHAFWKGGHSSTELGAAKVLTVGRALECDLRIDDASVSRQHVKIHVGPVVQLEDLGSSNGTRVSGRLLQARETVPIRAGDVVEIGGAMLVLRPALADLDAQSSESSPEMANVERLIDMVARSNIDVLLLGETGVGKEVAAENIHRKSARASSPLLRINCSALPDSMIEAELFGYEKGAFTGAVQAKRGLLEAANGGTIFLDEVGELSLATQVKLLRVVERREVLRIGSLRPNALDVRLVAATHVDLVAAVSARTFREDLYHRLNGVTIRVPPLRERVSEIVPLARTFLEGACAAAGRTTVRLSVAAERALEAHAWPGNVRELRKTMERAIVFCQADEIDAAHAPSRKVRASGTISLTRSRSGGTRIVTPFSRW